MELSGSHKAALELPTGITVPLLFTFEAMGVDARCSQGAALWVPDVTVLQCMQVIIACGNLCGKCITAPHRHVIR